MHQIVLSGILRAATRIARTSLGPLGVVTLAWLLTGGGGVSIGSAQSTGQSKKTAELNQSGGSSKSDQFESVSRYGETGEVSMLWDFRRSEDPEFRGLPDGWKRYEGVGYPKYVQIGIVAKDLELERQLILLDTALIQLWKQIRAVYPKVSLPESITDRLIDRYLRIDLDGGQAKYESPSVPTDRVFQYGLSCRVMTDGLQYDSARVELVFQDDLGDELAVHSTPRVTGTTDWKSLSIDLFRPPAGATRMAVRVLVDRGEDGLEDIRGAAGFDDLMIKRYPKLEITTDHDLGVYHLGEVVEAKAKVMGLPVRQSQVRFQLLDAQGRALKQVIETVTSPDASTESEPAILRDSSVTCVLPRLEPGFYEIQASIEGCDLDLLSADTTFVVIDPKFGGPPRGSFGWTLPSGSEGLTAAELATWLADLSVAWVKYPCWIDPEDTKALKETASVLGKLQEAGLQTVGILDHPPKHQFKQYSVNGRWDKLAGQLFRDPKIWQPLLDPVTNRLALKVRTWQLGADRDFSFLGRPQLSDLIRQIALGLQGFGQPIEVAICWPWMEREVPVGEASWQAVCRSSDPPLAANQLDAYLALRDEEFGDQQPRTWLLTDPIDHDQYDRETRIRDLVLRMATVRKHKVQAAFVSNPRDPKRGLLRSDGRPEALLLPWRTTSLMIGDASPDGSLKLRSGAENMIFVGRDQVVLMLWASSPQEEQIYLGDSIRMVDVWGRVTPLPNEWTGDQVVQRIPIGPLPIFVLGVDPDLLEFRRSVEMQPDQLDSYLGERQQLSVYFTNPTQKSLSGDLTLQAPKSWTIDQKRQTWENLAGRETRHDFNVVLSNTSKIGQYEVPLRFAVQTDPPQVITVHKTITVGPKGLDVQASTQLIPGGDLRVQIEMTNRTSDPQSYDCIVFPSAGRQYQRSFVTIEPGKTTRTEMLWPRGSDLVGTRMLLRANGADTRRVLNHAFEVTR